MKSGSLVLGMAFCVLECTNGCSKVTQRVAGPTESEIRTHALAFSAILDSHNGYLHSTLEVTLDPVVAKEQPEAVREMLAEWWGVHSRDELISLLVKMQSGEDGHRRFYWAIRHALLEARMENYLGVIQSEAKAGRGAEAFVVATHLAPLHGDTLPIAAWDFGRYIFLCRSGYNSGWLTEKESWFRIIPAARLIQSSYSSWSEFATEYLVGRNFWDPSVAKENNDMRYFITMLNFPPNGLWSTIPWNQSLGEGQVMRDTFALSVLKDYQDPDVNGVSMNYFPRKWPKQIMIQTVIDPK